MKSMMFMTALLLMAANVHAANYACTYSDAIQPSNTATNFEINTENQDNQFVNLGDEGAVGCIVLRHTTPLLTCGVGKDGSFSTFVTADDGTSILSLDVGARNGKARLTCVRQ